MKDDIARLSGRAFNVGGGPNNSMSVRELVQRIEHLTRRPPRVSHDEWQRADRRWYVSDTRELTRETGWTAKNSADVGVLRLFDWIEAHR